MPIKLSFDANQPFQLEAIQSVVDLFDGQPLKASEYAFSLTTNELLTEYGVGNALAITDEQLLANLQMIQERNKIEVSQGLEGRHFSVEMETGTGKTYIYLRTIYELNKQFGFTKFVVVVPSIAIREGVLKNLEITKDHFQVLYSRQPAHFEVYDSRLVSRLRSFATSRDIEILVLNIDSFAKDENVINKPNDRLSGKNPVEFIQATNPIVIVDEPQRMETPIRGSAIANLNPLCTLRYSATHLKTYNLVYSLSPVQAYDLGLVKQIEVDSVTADTGFNDAFVRLDSLRSTKTRTSVRLTIDVNTNKGVKRKAVTAKVEDDLFQLSNEREIYRDGAVITSIDITDQSIELSNGRRIYKGQATDTMHDEIMKLQLRRMVDEHFQKARRYEKEGIKVLSLVFIDRVANYRDYDDSGDPMPGKFAKWFEEIYNEMAALAPNKDVIPYSADRIHDGYFAQDNKGRFKDSSGTAQADEGAYELIMKKKELLLDINTPLRFIFSHSALREGWDNPNVFQICTLREVGSEQERRQQIGRGLRLCVNQDGQRVFDRQINRLTVFASESYEDFAKGLQTQIELETGIKFEGRIKNARDRRRIALRKGYQLDKNFLDLWNKIKQKTTYRVNYESNLLIETVVKKIKAMPSVLQPRIRAVRSQLKISEAAVTAEYTGNVQVGAGIAVSEVPDLIGYIQNRTQLTRRTILEILKKSGRLADALLNPQLFLDQVVHEIELILQELMIAGIKYQKISGSEYNMLLFEAREIDGYLEKMYTVQHKDKTITDYIVYASSIEERFARDCENDDQVEFFIKLPDWFLIETPIGKYRPDWALIFKNEKKLYFVAETKDVPEGFTEKLRRNELLKIKSGAAHFSEFKDVSYMQVTNLQDLLRKGALKPLP
jgi:type III restriction enzyme